MSNDLQLVFFLFILKCGEKRSWVKESINKREWQPSCLKMKKAFKKKKCYRQIHWRGCFYSAVGCHQQLSSYRDDRCLFSSSSFFFLNGANEVCNNVVDVTCCLVWVLSAPLRRLCLGRLLKAVDSKRGACCLVTKLVLL